ncbi:MAG: BCD family MFS transporter [Cyanobacteria bacterium P01_D01_bin.73]
MAAHSISPPPEPETEQLPFIPPLKLPIMFRLGLFQMALGIMSVLTLGVLNRVAIDELGIPATIAAGAIAMHQFVAPARVWFGQLSDSKPILRTYRTGYIWAGAAVFVTAALIAVQVLWRLGGAAQDPWQWNGDTIAWTGLFGLIFAVYGLALSSSSTPFAALLVDVSDKDQRSRLVGIVWSMLMVGIVIGAISTSILLRQVEAASDISVVQNSINGLFGLVPIVILVLTAIATWGVEKKYSRFYQRSTQADAATGSDDEREDKVTLARALRILTASRQTVLFFSFLIVMTMGLFLQEAVLEPYGGEVFGMSIGESTQLNAFFGMGTLISLGGAGFLIVPRLGKKATVRLGCLLVAACCLTFIAVGFTGDARIFKTSVFMFGLAAGITTTGAISLMLDLTVAETAGTFIGAWGLAQAMSRALATLFGGAVLDIGRAVFGQGEANGLASYGLVFTVQAAAMVVASLVLLRRVNVEEFQTKAETAVSTVLATEVD